MKKDKNKFLKKVADIAYVISEREANSVCYAFFCQPKLLEQVKKLRKW